MLAFILQWAGNLVLAANFRDFSRQYNLSNSFGIQIYDTWIIDSIS
jgi:hypothetical protein